MSGKKLDVAQMNEDLQYHRELNASQREADADLFLDLMDVGSWWTGRSASAMEAWAKRAYEEVTAIRDQKDKDIELTQQYLDRVVEKDRQYASKLAGGILNTESEPYAPGDNNYAFGAGTAKKGIVYGMFSLEYMDWLTKVTGKQDMEAIGAHFMDMGVSMQQVYDVYAELTENGVTTGDIGKLEKIGYTFDDVVKDYNGLGDRITDKEIYSYCLQGGEYFDEIEKNKPGSWKAILKGIAGNEQLSEETKIKLIDVTEGVGAYYRSTCTVDTPMTSASKPTESEKKLVRLCFEGVYPEKAKQVDDFFERGDFEDYEQEINDIKYIAYTAPEDYQTLFFGYIDRLTPVNRDNGNGGTAFYSMVEGDEKGKLNLYLKDNEAGDPYCPYATFFHEFGHAVDDMSADNAGGRLWSSGVYRNTDGKTVDECLTEEVREYVQILIDQKANDPQSVYSLTEEQKSIMERELIFWDRTPEERILEEQAHLTSGIFSGRSDSRYLMSFRDELIADFNANLGADNSKGSTCLADMFGSMSDKHGKEKLGYGHTESYWVNKVSIQNENGTYASVDYEIVTPPSTEFFSESFSMGMTGDRYSAGRVAAVLPDASSIYDELISSMAAEEKLVKK